MRRGNRDDDRDDDDDVVGAVDSGRRSRGAAAARAGVARARDPWPDAHDIEITKLIDQAGSHNINNKLNSKVRYTCCW